MKLPLKLTGVIGMALLGGCASFGNAPPHSIVGDALNFASYRSENVDRNRVGVAQVFEMDGKTVLQMQSASQTTPRISDAEGNPVSYTTTGSYIVLDRTPNQFTVSQGDRTATIARALGLPVPGSRAGSHVSPSMAPASGRSDLISKPVLSGALNSLPGEDMKVLANDADARERYLKMLESLQTQLNELRIALQKLGPPAQVGTVRAAHAKRKIAQKGPRRMVAHKPPVAPATLADGADGKGASPAPAGSALMP